MSKKTYFTQYDSPNIVIVPTLSLCTSSPSKKARLETTPNINKETMLSSEKNTNQHPKIIMKHAEECDINKINMEKGRSPNIVIVPTLSLCNSSPSKKARLETTPNIKKETINKINMEKSKTTMSSAGKENPEARIVMQPKEEEDKCNYNMETQENGRKYIMESSRKITNQNSEVWLQSHYPKENYNVKIDENVRKDTMSSSEIKHKPEIIINQTDDTKNKNEVSIKDAAYKKKVNTSWASNYMHSIGQIQKNTTRKITVNHLKTHKSHKVEGGSIKSNEGTKTMKLTLPNEASKDKNKNKPTPQKSTQPRKCKKIKLKITVEFQDPRSSSSDTYSNDGNDEDEPYVNADISFLEDINVDEIVKSLCESISNKKEEGPWKANDEFEENNNIKNNKDISIEKIKLEEKSPVSNNFKKEPLQNKDNIKNSKLHVVNIKTKDQSQTPNPSIQLEASKDDSIKPSLVIKSDNDQEMPQKSCLVIVHDDPKIKPPISSLVTECDDAKKRSFTSTKVVISEDAKESLSQSLLVTKEDAIKGLLTSSPEIKSAYAKVKPITPTKSIDIKAKPLTSSMVLKLDEAKEKSPNPISQIDSKDVEVKPVTPYLMIKKNEDIEKTLTRSLETKKDYAKSRPLTPMLVVTSDSKDKCPIQSLSVNSDDTKKHSLTPILVLKPGDTKEKDLTPISSIQSENVEVNLLTPCLITKDEVTTIPVAKTKPLTPRLSVNLEYEKSQSPKRNIIPNNNQDHQLTSSLEIKVDAATEKSLAPCSIKPTDNKEKPDTLTLLTKTNTVKENTKSPHMNIKPVDAKENPLIPSSLLDLDKAFAENLETRMFQYLNEKFTVISNIHKGKFSSIYCTMDSKKKKYAVKILNNVYDRSFLSVKKENMLIKLQREIPRDNLQFVYIHNGFSMKGQWCFLMDFYPKNLYQALEDNYKPFHIDKVQVLARQLVTAVTILRNSNIVHSDINPGHILLNYNNTTLKLCGFDRSYFRNDRESLLPNIGTVNYRAPEIIIGYSAGFSIDVWAIALVMFEMATKTKLFPGSFNNDILYKQICTLGAIPHQMVQKSLFWVNHFHGGKFVRRVGYKGQKIMILDQFNKNNKLQDGISKAYQYHWCKYRSKAQQKYDLEKLGLFRTLLEKMLLINPNCRIPIEFVYVNPFIYEFF